MKLTHVLLLTATAVANAASPDFDADWQAARKQPMPSKAYETALDAYYRSDRFDATNCDRNLQGEQHARLLLDFDAAGTFSIRSDSTSSELALCLSNSFAANPPPRPDILPTSLPYEFRRR